MCLSSQYHIKHKTTCLIMSPIASGIEHKANLLGTIDFRMILKGCNIRRADKFRQ